MLTQFQETHLCLFLPHAPLYELSNAPAPSPITDPTQAQRLLLCFPWPNNPNADQILTQLTGAALCGVVPAQGIPGSRGGALHR